MTSYYLLEKAKTPLQAVLEIVTVVDNELCISYQKSPLENALAGKLVSSSVCGIASADAVLSAATIHQTFCKYDEQIKKHWEKFPPEETAAKHVVVAPKPKEGIAQKAGTEEEKAVPKRKGRGKTAVTKRRPREKRGREKDVEAPVRGGKRKKLVHKADPKMADIGVLMKLNAMKENKSANVAGGQKEQKRGKGGKKRDDPEPQTVPGPRPKQSSIDDYFK